MSVIKYFQIDERLVKIVFLIVLLNISFFFKATQKEFPYSMGKSDLFLVPTGIGSLAAYKQIRSNAVYLSPEEVFSLDRSSINIFDRTATYNWSPAADDLSDYTNMALIFTPLLLSIPQLVDTKWKNALSIGLMYTEVYMLTKGITKIVQYGFHRTRPYMYNNSLSDEFRFEMADEPSICMSFISGHTTGAFASAVFLSKIYTDIYGKSKWSTMIWIGSLTLASTTAYLRVAAGRHYPTDVLAGAAIGSAIGYLVPVLHKRKSKKFSFLPASNGFFMSYTF